MTNAQKKLMWFVGVIIALILIQKAFIFYTDYLWFDSMDLASVFLTVLKSRILLFFVFGGLFFLWLYGNAKFARQPLPEDVTLIGKRLLPEEEREQIEEYADQAVLIFCIVGALMVGFVAAGHWREYLQFLNAVSFGGGHTDPLFGREAGFYIFKYPFIQYAWRSLFYGVVISLVVSVLIHLYQESIRIVGNTVQAIQRARLHVLGLLALGFFAKIYSYQLMKYGLLFSQRGDGFFGATYADVHARLPVITILMVLCGIAGIVSLVSVRSQSVNVPVGALAAVFLVSILGGWAYPLAINTLIVKPNELAKEKPYIEFNIAGTNRAYATGPDNVAEKLHPIEPKLTWDNVNDNVPTIANIRLWDHRPLETSYNQLQALRRYYKFADVDVDRYQLDQRVRQVMLAARQMDWSKVGQSWVNRHLLYTHGYGLALSPVAEITESDGPVLWVKDLPPVSEKVPELTRPGIYYGVSRHPRLIERIAPPEYARDTSSTPQSGQQPGGGGQGGPGAQQAPQGRQQPGPSPAAQRTTQARQTVPQYHLVNTKARELDYPRAGESVEGEATENVYTHYQGSGGVKLNSLWRKIVFTIRFRDIQILLTDYITTDSRLQMYRELPERLAVIAPFLGYDPDPYIVLNEDGTLKWICDAYTLSNYYPYSVRTSWFGNYLRNSVKVTVDAYEGQPRFHIVDPDDPVVQCYQKIFPNLFEDFAQMPEYLKHHMRYPELMFRIQAGIYAKYHQREPQTFYQGEDEWAIPPEVYSDSYREVEAYYQVVKLPHEQEEEFLLMVPYVLAGFERKNMVAWMAGRCDLENYGELLCYNFPKERLVYGPMQFEAQIDQDSQISELMTLWSQSGSNVIRGNALAIPVANSLLYVEPIYLESEDSAIPELRLVVLMHQDRLVHAPTLDEALVKLLGPGEFAGPKLAEDARVPTAEEPAEEAVEAEEAPQPAEEQTGVVTELSDAAIQQLRQTLSDALELDKKAEAALKEGDLGKYRDIQQEQAELLKDVWDKLQ